MMQVRLPRVSTEIAQPAPGLSWSEEGARVAAMYEFDTPTRRAAFEGCVSACFAASSPTRRKILGGIPDWLKWAGIGFAVHMFLTRKRD